MTNSGSGSGSTVVSAVIGATVSSVTENSATSILELDNNNTFTGGLYILNGNVFANNGSDTGALGAGTVFLGDTSGSNSATLGAVTGTFSNPIVVQAGSSGNTLIIETEGTTQSASFSGPITLNNNVTFDETRSAARTLTISGQITGGSTITIINNNNSGGALSITGPNATSFTGNIIINSGGAGILGFNQGSLGETGTISFFQQRLDGADVDGCEYRRFVGASAGLGW